MPDDADLTEDPRLADLVQALREAAPTPADPARTLRGPDLTLADLEALRWRTRRRRARRPSRRRSGDG